MGSSFSAKWGDSTLRNSPQEHEHDAKHHSFCQCQNTMATVGNLQPNQGYYCSVAAHTIARGDFELSMFVITTEDGNYNLVFVTHYYFNDTIMISCYSVPSGAPSQLSAYDVTSTSFKLNWTELPLEEWNGHITGYEIEVIGDGNKETMTTLSQAVTISVNKSGTYCVSVAAMTSVGAGPYSEIIIITTLSDSVSTDRSQGKLSFHNPQF